MSPAAIARRAVEAGLDVAAITDHNSAHNAPAFAEVCAQLGLSALFGAEANTAEEIHALCLFDAAGPAREFGEWLYERLAPVPLRADRMGDQPVVNALDQIECMLDLFLGAAAAVTLTDLCGEVHARGGLFVPSHIDRPVNGLLSQLGRIPDLPFDAVEVSPRYDRHRDPAGVRGRFAMVRSSDAHELEEIGRGWTILRTEEISVSGFREALRRLARDQSVDPDAGLPGPSNDPS
jgi:hypothetical protein